MALNFSVHYVSGELYVDAIPVKEITQQTGTPVYIYSLKQTLKNYRMLKEAFHKIGAEIHYSAKANANLHILRALIEAGAGIDAVSGGEIYRALQARARANDIVFAGVGKHPEEIRYAIEQGVGWFNVENVGELQSIDQIATSLGRDKIRIALRLNPEVTANTHPYIATGHGGAKFGLTADVIRDILTKQTDYPRLSIEGLHIHIGSQLGDMDATTQAIEKARDLIHPYKTIHTLNIGGGFPAAYQIGEVLPDMTAFADHIKPLLEDYHVILEPGRSIIGDAGILVGTILYTKEQAGQTLYITDTSMTDLIRPALYQAQHTIIPIIQREVSTKRKQIVGPVCESADVLGRDVALGDMSANEQIAILTAGAYGMVMASNYNARPRPSEVIVAEDGEHWFIGRKRETWEDLVQAELLTDS